MREVGKGGSTSSENESANTFLYIGCLRYPRYLHRGSLHKFKQGKRRESTSASSKYDLGLRQVRLVSDSITIPLDSCPCSRREITPEFVPDKEERPFVKAYGKVSIEPGSTIQGR